MFVILFMRAAGRLLLRVAALALLVAISVAMLVAVLLAALLAAGPLVEARHASADRDMPRLRATRAAAVVVLLTLMAVGLDGCRDTG